MEIQTADADLPAGRLPRMPHDRLPGPCRHLRDSAAFARGKEAHHQRCRSGEDPRAGDARGHEAAAHLRGKKSRCRSDDPGRGHQGGSAGLDCRGVREVFRDVLLTLTELPLMKNPENLSAPDAIQRDADRQPKSYLHKREISAHMIRDLYERGRISILFLLMLISVIRWVIDAAYVADATVRGTFFLLIAINVARWLFMMLPAQRRDALLGLREQLALFACGVFLTSAILGTIVVLVWPLLDTAHISIFAVIIAGLVSGASMSLGFSPLVYMLYTLPLVGMLFLMCVTDQRPDWGADILATAFALYAVSVLVMSIDQSRKH